MSWKALGFGFCVVVLAACGEDGGDAGGVPEGGGLLPEAGGIPDGSIPDGGDDAGDGAQAMPDLDNDLTAQVPAITCEAGAYPCRGACFTTPGEKHNRCELVAIGPGPLEAIALDDAHVYATSPDTRELLRVQKSGGTLAAIVSDVDTQGRPQVAAGMVYFTQYKYAPDLDNYFSRVPVAGGTVEDLHDPTPSENFAAKFSVIGDYAYFYGDAEPSLHRLPLSGGSQEDLVTTGIINHLAVDAAHYYYQRGSEFDIARAPIASPESFEVLYGDAFGAPIIEAPIFLSPADDAHLYYVENEIRRIAKATGQIEIVYDGPMSGNLMVGPAYVLFAGNDGITAVPHAGGDLLRLTAEGGYGSQMAEDDTHFYVAGQAIFRIQKP